MRRVTHGFSVALSVVLIAGCARSGSRDAPLPEDAAAVARIVCEKDHSTSISTPHVRALRDGVHVRVINRLDEGVSMNGLGFDVSPGASDRVSAYRPGVLNVALLAVQRSSRGRPRPGSRSADRR